MKRLSHLALGLTLALCGCSSPTVKGGNLQSNPHQISKDVVVPASSTQVWEAWSTVEGVKTFLAPEARIELQPGGAYEMYFDPKQEPGHRGSEGCTVLSVEPGKRLVFTWNFPPSLPAIRDQKTVVELTLIEESDGARTRVRLMQRGFKTGSDWQKGREYFDSAWDKVLGRLVKRFESGPVDLSQ